MTRPSSASNTSSLKRWVLAPSRSRLPKMSTLALSCWEARAKHSLVEASQPSRSTTSDKSIGVVLTTW